MKPYEWFYHSFFICSRYIKVGKFRAKDSPPIDSNLGWITTPEIKGFAFSYLYATIFAFTSIFFSKNWTVQILPPIFTTQSTAWEHLLQHWPAPCSLQMIISEENKWAFSYCFTKTNLHPTTAAVNIIAGLPSQLSRYLSMLALATPAFWLAPPPFFTPGGSFQLLASFVVFFSPGD